MSTSQFARGIHTLHIFKTISGSAPPKTSVYHGALYDITVFKVPLVFRGHLLLAKFLRILAIRLPRQSGLRSLKTLRAHSRRHGNCEFLWNRRPPFDKQSYSKMPAAKTIHHFGKVLPMLLGPCKDPYWTPRARHFLLHDFKFLWDVT